MERDEQLVGLILQGQGEKFRVLVERYQREIYRFLARMGLDHDEIADVLQISFVKAYNKLHTLREGKGFRNWLYAIAANNARNYLRGLARQFPLEDIELASPDELPDARVEKDSLRNLIAGILARLPEDQRQVVVLRTYENMPFKEVALACNMSLTNAKVTYHRALKKMQGWLKHTASEVN